MLARTTVTKTRCVPSLSLSLSQRAIRGDRSFIITTPKVTSPTSLRQMHHYPSISKLTNCRLKSSMASDGADIDAQPSLQKVPTLPLIGSIPFTSKIPSLNEPYKFWPEMRKRYGDFYSFGLPGLGKSDAHGTLYVINDPQEMLKVVRSGGAYPSGLAEGIWPQAVWGRENKLATYEGDKEGLGGKGESWRNYRKFMQTDLLSPSSARGYVPCIIEAAELASKAAPAWKGNFNFYTNHAAFDMFASMILGELCNTSDPSTPTDPDNKRFVEGALVGLSTMVQLTRLPYENLMSQVFGIKTEMYNKFADSWGDAWAVGRKKIESFTERKKQGLLTEAEKVSYLSRAIDRQEEEGSNVSLREAQEIVLGGLSAAVDTTASKIAWSLLHVARLPHVQQRLYEEISAAVAESGGGRLTEDIFNWSTTPYLHAVVRESHRLTPIGPVTLVKQIGEDDLSIHGVPLPKGTTVAFDSFSHGYDPEYVEDPQEFKPERWLQDAVDARKGTSKEIIDHPFFKEPFGQGPRRCPGSRVALNETKVMLSQLLLDWKITSPVTSLEDIKAEQQTTYVCMLPDLQFEPRN